MGEREREGERVRWVRARGGAARGEVRKRRAPAWGRWRSVFQMSLCVSPVNHPSVSRRPVKKQFMNFSSIKFLSGGILAVIHGERIDTRVDYGRKKMAVRAMAPRTNNSGETCLIKSIWKAVPTLASLQFAPIQIRNASNWLSSLLMRFRSNQLFSPKLRLLLVRLIRGAVRRQPPHTPSVILPFPAIFSSPSSRDSSPSLPPHCLLPGWYERITPEPSGVKWYKVIGRSPLLTGRPLKGHPNGANRILPLLATIPSPRQGPPLPPPFPPSPVHQRLVSHDQGEASEGGWLMMLLVPV